MQLTRLTEIPLNFTIDESLTQLSISHRERNDKLPPGGTDLLPAAEAVHAARELTSAAALPKGREL